MKYRAIIVDDESLAREMLREMLYLIHPDIHIVALCEDVPEAVKAINKFRPDLVFLDINMPRYKGIDIAEFFDEIDFDIIFTTAHQQYTLDAIKIQAFDYLLKPIDLDDLRDTLDRFVKKRTKQEVDIVSEGKLLVNTTQVVHFIDFHDIVYFKAEGAYTKIVCTETIIMASKNLKYYEEYLTGHRVFFRCHKSFIVNKEKITRINKVKQEVSLSTGEIVLVSLEKLDGLLEF